MSESFFNITIRGEETLTNELNDLVGDIKNVCGYGLQFASSEMISSLQEHIQRDWYDPWGPPKDYERRTDHPGDGTPLGDERNMNVRVSDLSLSFIYAPTGKHTVRAWNKRSGDALINTIQTGSGWSWKPTKDRKNREIMPRPFWNNFVEEQRNGALFDAFEYGFSGRGFDLIREGKNRDMDFPANEGMLESSFIGDDIDLPL